MPDISVVVTFYNQDYKKLFQTLYSAIIQEDVSFDIIVTDDGSDDFDQEQIEEWFKSHHFDSYTIIANKVNQGTVINTLTGWNHSNSKYIKMLSPGDLLYDNRSLHNLLEYMESVEADLCFGRIAPYRLDEDGNIVFVELNQPEDLTPYINYDKEQIQRNYLLKKDYACGMSFAGKREVMLEYIKKIAGKTRYFEDCTYILMVAAGRNIRLYNHYIIWYDVGEGISTSGDRKADQRKYAANWATYEIVRREYPEWRDSYKPYNLQHRVVRLLKTSINQICRDNRTVSGPNYPFSEKHHYNEKMLKSILSME